LIFVLVLFTLLLLNEVVLVFLCIFDVSL